MNEEIKSEISKAAQALVRLGKGKKKTLTDEERQRRINHMKSLNEKRKNKKRNENN